MSRPAAAILLLFMFSLPTLVGVSAITDSGAGTWKEYRDPLGEVVRFPNIEFSEADDALAVAYIGEDDTFKFATAQKAASGLTLRGSITSDTWNGYPTDPNIKIEPGEQPGEWAVAYIVNGSEVQIHHTTDNGATWDQTATISGNYTNIDIDQADDTWMWIGYGRYDASVDEGFKFKRSADDFATWNKETLRSASSVQFPCLFGVEALQGGYVWTGLSYHTGGGSSSTGVISNSFSDDYGSFWTAASSASLGGFSNSFGTCRVVQGASPTEVVLGGAKCCGSSYQAFRFSDLDESGVNVGDICNSGQSYDYGGVDYETAYCLAGTTITSAAGNIGGLPSMQYPQMRVTQDQVAVSFNNLDFSGRYEIWVQALAIGPGGDASVELTNIVGFDVDSSGSTVVARTDAGTTVRTFNALPLTVAATTPASTNCQRVDGVTTMDEYVAFLECDSGTPSDVIGIHVQTRTLAEPPFADLCDPEDFCSNFAGLAIMGDTDTSQGTGTPDGDNLDAWGDIAQVLSVPIDYSGYSTEGLNHVPMAIAYTDTDGRVGVMVYTWINNADDNVKFDSELYTSQAPDALAVCAEPLAADGTEDPADGSTFRMYTASNLADPRAYNVLVERTDGAFAQPTYTPTMTAVFAGAGSTTGAQSVACGLPFKATYASTSTLTIWDCEFCGSASPIHTETINGGLLNGVAMSENGRWVAFVDADGGHVICADVAGCFNDVLNTTVALGAEVYTFALPSGNFVGIKLQGAGANVWVATSDFIVRHNIAAFTTGTELTYNPGLIDLEAGPAPAQEEIGGSVYGEAIANAAAASGADPVFIGGLMAGILIVVAGATLAVPLFLLTNSATVAAIGFFVGGVLGFMLTIMLDLLDQFWATFLIMLAILVAVIAGSAFLGRR